MEKKQHIQQKTVGNNVTAKSPYTAHCQVTSKPSQNMSKLKILSLIILALILTNCNRPDKETAYERKYKTVTSFLKVDTLPKFKYMLETQDLSGRVLDRVRYSQTTGLINYIEKYYYDSLQRAILTNTTWLPEHKHPHTNTNQLVYDSTGLILKSISTMGFDTNTIYYAYHPNKKIKQSKTISSSDVWWQGIIKYTYNENDSLVKEESLGLESEGIQSSDSIAYTDTSKIIFEFHDANKISSKSETIYKKTLIARQVEYRTHTMAKDRNFYIERESIFMYNESRLTKKIVKTMAHTDWCGVETPEQIETYTYLYE